LANIKPDILLVLGDRSEMLAGAIAATYLGIPIAHIHGGDISGNVDEPVRHAITKLAHIHFPATQESAQRIIKMGEEPWRVHVVGAPGLDLISTVLAQNEQIGKKYKLDLNKPLLIVIQHSVVTEANQASAQIVETLEAIKELGHQTVIIYPNADAGGRRMIDVIKRYEDCSFIKVFESIPHMDYLKILSMARAIVGNSSSGIIEAPSLGVSVVNIGNRQFGRQRGQNVIDVDYKKEEIIRAVRGILNRTCKNKLPVDNIYGDGKAGERIAKVLSETVLEERLLKKRMTY